MAMSLQVVVATATLLAADAFFLPDCLWDEDSWNIPERNPVSRRYRRFLWDDSDVCDWMCDPDLLPHEICNTCCRRSPTTTRSPVDHSPSLQSTTGSSQISSSSQISKVQPSNGMTGEQLVLPQSNTPFQVQLNVPEETPLIQPEVQAPQVGLSNSQNWPQLSQQNQNWPQPFQQNQNWPQPPQQNQNWAQPPQQNQNWPQPFQQNQNWPQPPQQNQNWAQPPQQSQNWPQPSQQNQKWLQPSQPNQNWPQSSQQNQNMPESSPQNQNWPQLFQQNQNWPQPPQQNQNWAQPPQQNQNWPQPPLQSMNGFNGNRVPFNQNEPTQTVTKGFAVSPISNEPLNVQVPINLTGLFQAQVPSQLTTIFEARPPAQNQGVPQSSVPQIQIPVPQTASANGNGGPSGQNQPVASSNIDAVPVPTQSQTPQTSPANGGSGVVQDFVNWMTQPFTQSGNGQLSELPIAQTQQDLSNVSQQQSNTAPQQQFQTAGDQPPDQTSQAQNQEPSVVSADLNGNVGQ